MAILVKGTDFVDGEQITSAKLDNLVDNATFASGSVESGGGIQLNGSGQLKVAGNIDIGTSNLTATGTISLGTTSFNDNNITNVGSIALDTITNDGTDVTIDSSGDIILDADGAQIRIKDAGTERFVFNTDATPELDVSGGDFTIHANTSDADIIFTGNDGGSTITALTLDMSAAGAATFNDKITATELDISGDVTVDTTTLKVDSTNNRVGIGTATPVHSLSVFKDANAARTEIGIDNTDQRLVLGSFYESGGLQYATIQSTNNAETGAQVLALQPDGGNVGIGTASPAEKLEIAGNAMLDATDANLKIKSGAAGTTGAIYYTFNTDSTIYGRVDLPYDTRASVGLRMKSTNGYPITIDGGNGINFAEDGTEFAEFTSAGHFYHNLTGTGAFPGLQNDTHGLMSEDQGANGNTLHVSRLGSTAAHFARNTNDGTLIGFYSTAAGGTSAASLAGTIEIDSATTVSIQSASDYRIKENIVLVSDGIDRLKQMPVYKFNFTHDADRVVDGFLAHEVQPIVPEAVKGEKDGMKEEEFLVSPEVRDEEGQVVTEAVVGTRTVEKYQTMDQSKLVPLLTAALQEAVAKIEALEARVATLEG